MYSIRIHQNSYKADDDHRVKGYWDIDTFYVSTKNTDDNTTLRVNYGHGPHRTLQQDAIFDLKYNCDNYLICHNDSMKIFEGLGLLMDYIVPLFEKASSIARYNYKPSDAREVMVSLDDISHRLRSEEQITQGFHNNSFGNLVICSLGSKSNPSRNSHH